LGEGEKRVSSTIIKRIVAWGFLAAAIALTVLPLQFRPVTEVPRWLEHLVFFTALGMVFAFAYSRRPVLLCAAAIAFSLVLEILQIFVPGRHARLSDFLIDATSASIGILLPSLARRGIEGPNPS
jgi:VanZ family protein